MAWRRRRKTLNEELLEQGAREAAHLAEALEAEEPAAPRAGQGRALVTTLALFLASMLVHFAPVPLPVKGLLALLFIAYFAFTARSRLRRPRRARIGVTRALLLIWLAVSVAVSVLVALGGFYREDLVLLAVVWTILGVVWMIDRLLPRVRSTLTSG
jgi:hypothetical protein